MNQNLDPKLEKKSIKIERSHLGPLPLRVSIFLERKSDASFLVGVYQSTIQLTKFFEGFAFGFRQQKGTQQTGKHEGGENLKNAIRMLADCQ
jgi:hypothetical protein